MKKIILRIASGILVLSMTGCVSVQPQSIDNVCSIFNEYPEWYWAAQATEKKWGVSIPVQMAIMRQESSFVANARPPRKWCLGIIPWKRPTSAYGYSQAIDQTWDNYQKQTRNYSASRCNFKDASDFVGWYVQTANRKLKISKTNSYALYLAYHEGLNGYAAKTYRNQLWLKAVARKVSLRSRTYQRQLNRCQSSLPKKHWWQ